MTAEGRAGEIPVGEQDLVIVTLGSMTEASSLGSMDSAPVLKEKADGGAWTLWERLATGRPRFGRPSAFDDHVDESRWISFTTTQHDPTFSRIVRDATGNVAGEGGLVTFTDSGWLLSIVLPHQPHFLGQPEDVNVFWGYGLFVDRPGDFVNKPMSACTGREIMTEVMGHLRIGPEADRIMQTSTCIPCMMPFITSQFLRRERGDRPQVIPEGSANLALVGQFCELPHDVVFTVEYSVRSAQEAVYSLLGLDLKPPAVYKGYFDPRVLYRAFKACTTSAIDPLGIQSRSSFFDNGALADGIVRISARRTRPGTGAPQSMDSENHDPVEMIVKLAGGMTPGAAQAVRRGGLRRRCRAPRRGREHRLTAAGAGHGGGQAGRPRGRSRRSHAGAGRVDRPRRRVRDAGSPTRARPTSGRGSPIDAYCDQERLDPRARLRLFQEVCRSVHAAHQRGMIHGGLSLRKIRVGADGTPRVIAGRHEAGSRTARRARRHEPRAGAGRAGHDRDRRLCPRRDPLPIDDRPLSLSGRGLRPRRGRQGDLRAGPRTAPASRSSGPSRQNRGRGRHPRPAGSHGPRDGGEADCSDSSPATST